MKRCGKILAVSLMVSLAIMSLSAVCFAGSGAAENPPGTAPYGVVMHGDAQGIKLYGILSIAYSGSFYCSTAYGNMPCTNAKVVLQLQRSNGGASSLYAEGALPVDPGLQQEELISMFKEGILNKFFDGNQSLNITLVSLGPIQVVGPGNGMDDNVVTEITLAVK